ncbi:hypothetical protein [Secundilactobacillus kimchicus]|uniref:Uncharacterized protein n=2 Tax=Secundilactobacillus kimchicus TaxID=528209 RepID=A0A0R1HNY0_9LACO|nr:hypothetical protein [Secundilactobacillus kimchicus]KRK48136.1 hypothetical protein FC96_GL001868 [Secundilactobacillus kimchicus JCM 15530]
MKVGQLIGLTMLLTKAAETYEKPEYCLTIAQHEERENELGIALSQVRQTLEVISDLAMDVDDLAGHMISAGEVKTSKEEV